MHATAGKETTSNKEKRKAGRKEQLILSYYFVRSRQRLSLQLLHSHS
jgi:hypothetical protein